MLHLWDLHLKKLKTDKQLEERKKRRLVRVWPVAKSYHQRKALAGVVEFQSEYITLAIDIYKSYKQLSNIAQNINGTMGIHVFCFK